MILRNKSNLTFDCEGRQSEATHQSVLAVTPEQRTSFQISSGDGRTDPRDGEATHCDLRDATITSSLAVPMGITLALSGAAWRDACSSGLASGVTPESVRLQRVVR
jgi:hypothetical protein